MEAEMQPYIKRRLENSHIHCKFFLNEDNIFAKNVTENQTASLQKATILLQSILKNNDSKAKNTTKFQKLRCSTYIDKFLG